MKRIANSQELSVALRAILAEASQPNPSRDQIAVKLADLSDRLAGNVFAGLAGEATFKKLKDGSWGLLVNKADVRPGDQVLTVTKAGQRSTKTVGKVLWSGQGVSICSIADEKSDRGFDRQPVRRAPGGKIECEECGDFVTPGTRCWETGMMH